MQLYRAERAGQLPASDGVVVENVTLPPGRSIVPAAGFVSRPTTEPVLWISDVSPADVAATWRDLAESFGRHGLWPLVLETLRRTTDRPWHAGELDPALSTDPTSHDAATVLAHGWHAALPTGAGADLGVIEPFGREFPGLAAATAGSRLPIGDVVEDLSGRLGLVATTRPADIPAIVGWTGPLNHEADMAKFAAVMRTWEERFGAYLVGLGFDTMTIAVERPPQDETLALAIAAEHFAFCPDNVYQGSGSLELYASELVGARTWTFWWD